MSMMPHLTSWLRMYRAIDSNKQENVEQCKQDLLSLHRYQCPVRLASLVERYRSMARKERDELLARLQKTITQEALR